MVTIEAGSEAGPAPPSRIREVGNEIGVSFPEDYLAFIASSNGGTPVRPYFGFRGNTKVIERFLSFIPDYKHHPLGDYDVEVVWSQVEDRLPPGAVPIAAMFAGDLLCLEEREGTCRVALWVHDSADPRALIPVAESFQALVEILHP